nr:3-phosphoshikimate 1-carboxyvinyltransferase [FCB group bacterium]
LVTGGGFFSPDQALGCGKSGTTARPLSRLLTRRGITAELTGDHSLSSRPMKRILEPLQQMGADIHADQNRLPIFIKPAKLDGIEYKTPVASAQIKSAILLAGLSASGMTTVEETEKSRDHTEIMLSEMGAKLTIQGNSIRLNPSDGKLKPLDIHIPADPSTAAFFAGAAAYLPGSDLLLTNILANETRTGFFQVLKKMGADIEKLNLRKNNGEPVCDYRIRGRQLHAVEISGSLIPSLIDELPVLAVIASCAEGTTTVTNAGELRVKETDRIHAICCNLAAMGVNVEEREDGFSITGPCKLHGAVVKTWSDHRIAMAFTVAGLAADTQVLLDDPDCIEISCPDFVELLNQVVE